MKSCITAAKVNEGMQFGRWTVLGDSIRTTRGETKWLCRCDCGTERYVLERSLIHGGSTSCGCRRKENAALALAGQVFGELTVLHKAAEQRPNGGIWWTCQCACGEVCDVPGSLLINGRKTRCSSRVHAKNYAYNDIAGQTFGLLTALYPARRYDKSGSVIWHCRCQCGQETDVSYNRLLYTNQISCGCRKKAQEQKLNSFLVHVANTSVDMLKSKKVPTDNTTGYKGVYLVKGKYMAKIVFQKKQYFLGTYDQIEEAAEARKEAEEVLFDGMSAHYAKWKQKAEADVEWASENPIQVIVTQNAEKRLSAAFLPEI